jgi:lysophospholipase L1-like esterase
MSSRLNFRDDWTLVSRPLVDLQERAQRAGGRLLVLASPEMTGATPKPVGNLDQLQQFAASRGIEVVDLTQWVAGMSSKTISMDGVHFNAEGHRIIGERLADYLLRHDLEE